LQFAAKNADVFWGVDADANTTAMNRQHRDPDVRPDAHLLTKLATEYQHGAAPP
jgi:hypothetical protein